MVPYLPPCRICLLQYMEDTLGEKINYHAPSRNRMFLDAGSITIGLKYILGNSSAARLVLSAVK
jgi:hypothetical protein